MRVLRVLAVCVALFWPTAVQAEPPVDAEDAATPVPTPPAGYHLPPPCIGRGYTAYGYPAIDSCPCARRHCYHPAKYYCGGACYRRAWWTRWLKAHAGHGSMLDAYPCRCRFPVAGRPHSGAATVPVVPAEAGGSNAGAPLPPPERGSSVE